MRTQQRNNTSLPHLHSQLTSQLTSRQLPLLYDYLSPQPSHLLDISLEGFPPASPPPLSRTTLPAAEAAHPLPLAYHLVYFPPAIPSNQLLLDGTDPLQSPGPSFLRRMWAGGRVRTNKEWKSQPRLRGRRAVCIEGIRDVRIKGVEGDEKIFVGIERRISELGHDRALDPLEEKQLRERYWPKHEEDMGESGVVERRDLVFMRERSRQVAADAAKVQGKVVKRTSPFRLT